MAGGFFELVHPPCVEDLRLDYEEALEIWEVSGPEEARDALRYVLAGCSANLWVHLALGRIALHESKDLPLARGHLGYVVELVERALPRGFDGLLPEDRPGNRPYHDAADELGTCLERLKLMAEAKAVRERSRHLRGRGAP